ncbi:RNA polymerase sigma factor [Chitinophaga sp. 22321]|uniref:RNA polymerase sigma-70 factor n=1 Tax=Chitinophaga hostae TaxID=2831022 RepID=A0ABS5IXH2_9BACT|nr:RNA polymerase sigma-70 factor [Chitinophaga hostae]MBS0027679.1 RNA polymerase sigma-70 factor [Chitinophaga hostae]
MKILADDIQKQLLTLLIKSDEPAFNELYKVYSKPLYLRILRMVKNQDDAQELLQELFIKLWNKRETIDIEKSFQSYLYTIAQNLVFNHFRKIANDQSLVKSLLINATEYYLDRIDSSENNEIARVLHQAIDQLPPQGKKIFQLCKLSGKSYEEVADILGISIATVNSHMTKSLQSIRKYVITHRNVISIVLTTYITQGTFK